ncbi:hypothetical protein ZIOFF_051262 [Zingiber officinale]|uniref:Uncharacterized protein n=1 Tax=Zingiber officinale TaxID=94328 RepID=A0A8J5FSD5_ZINOF|nr:hypothetical protein ZIOFF_051262 [Zingiber officinale]
MQQMAMGWRRWLSSYRATADREYYVHQDVVARQDYLYSGHYKSNLPRGPQNAAVTCLQKVNHFDYQQYNLQQEGMSFMLTEILLIKMSQMFSPMSDVLPTILLPPSAFLRPKYALWDCPRPAHASKWCQDCCRRFHASRAINEGAPGMAPVLHRGGIDLKDGPLFSALSIRYLGKMSGFQFVKSDLIFVFLKENHLEKGFSLTSQEGNLRVEIESKGLY